MAALSSKNTAHKSAAYSPMLIHSPACLTDCQEHAQITVGYNAQRDEEYKAA